MRREGKSKAPALALLKEKEEYVARLNEPAKVADIEQLRRDMHDVLAAVLGQQAEIAKLNRAIAGMRVSRSQELALGEAIRKRAKEICESESLPGICQRRVAAAIRTTLRELTGARSMGDVQAGQFDVAMGQIAGWHMSGAIRRIRRETEDAHEG